MTFTCISLIILTRSSPPNYYFLFYSSSSLGRPFRSGKYRDRQISSHFSKSRLDHVWDQHLFLRLLRDLSPLANILFENQIHFKAEKNSLNQQQPFASFFVNSLQKKPLIIKAYQAGSKCINYIYFRYPKVNLKHIIH